jgi:formate/nitrite transporter FocA (FNT family)
MDAFTPQQTIELVSRIGCKKSHMRLDKLWFNSFMAGPLLGFGCAVALSTETAPWYQENAPGLIRTIGAVFFPIGLVMIVLSGADLFTSNVMFMLTAFLHRRVTFADLLINWVVSFLGNLAGMLFFMAIITGCEYSQRTQTLPNRY